MSITNNRKAYHDYFIEEKFEAGIILEGWEVKAIRSGKAQLRDCYIRIKDGEVWMIGCQITPLLQASTHISADSTRTKKLLLKQKDINRLIGKVKEKGYSIVALDLHYTRGMVKADIALVKGKKQHDKRAVEKEREMKKYTASVVKQYKRM